MSPVSLADVRCAAPRACIRSASSGLARAFRAPRIPFAGRIGAGQEMLVATGHVAGGCRALGRVPAQSHFTSVSNATGAPPRAWRESRGYRSDRRQHHSSQSVSERTNHARSKHSTGARFFRTCIKEPNGQPGRFIARRVQGSHAARGGMSSSCAAHRAGAHRDHRVYAPRASVGSTLALCVPALAADSIQIKELVIAVRSRRHSCCDLKAVRAFYEFWNTGDVAC